MASSRGVTFRGDRAEQSNGKPICQLFCSTAVKKLSTLCGSHGTRAVVHQVCVDTSMHVWTSRTYYACLCCVCAMIRVRVCKCERVCVFVCWNPTFMFLFFYSACCCWCCRIMSSVSRRPSSSQALDFGADTVQQQSRCKFVWTTTYYACVGIAYACVLCVL